MDRKDRPESAFDTWSQSVVVEIQHEGENGHLVISNTSDAAECLAQLWPDLESPEFARARVMCDMALKGQLEHAQARSAFVEAAQEAEIMVPLH